MDTSLRFFTKVFVDGIEERLAALQSQWHESDIEALHVMRTLHVIVDYTSAGRAKGLDCVELVFLHPSRLTASDYRHCFPSVYAIWRNRMSVQISN